jgi:hypothetical protein
MPQKFSAAVEERLLPRLVPRRARFLLGEAGASAHERGVAIGTVLYALLAPADRFGAINCNDESWQQR